MKIETTLNLNDKIYLKGIKEHLGHIEAIVTGIHIVKTGIEYTWEQYSKENQLFDFGTFTESDIGQSVFQTFAEWSVSSNEELIELNIIKVKEEGTDE